MQIPTTAEIRALHERHAPTREALDLVYTHCEIVWEIAHQRLAAADLPLDAELVRAGSLLHDIGVYRLYGASGRIDHALYLRHGVLGEELLAEEGYPEILARFCSHHTGMGLTRADVQSQGLPVPDGDYLAESGEEELVMFADKFHSKSDPSVFVTAASCAASISRFGEDKAQAFTAMLDTFGAPDLRPLMDRYGYALV